MYLLRASLRQNCSMVKQLKTNKMKKKNSLMTVVAFFAITTITLAQVPTYVPTSGLVGWWPFNGNANDESINGNNGVVNGPILTTDRFGNSNKAYSFDGVNDNINPLQNNLPFGTTARTISIWFQRIGTGGNLFSYGSANTSNAYMISIGANIISNQGWADDFPVYPSIDNSWHNLVCTFDGLNSTIYLDNSNLGSNSMTSWNTIAGSFYFGTRVLNDMDFFNGNIDDIAIWNRSLTPCEIQALYQSGTSSMTVNATASTICSGLSTTLTASGATTYSWMPGSLSGNSVVVTPSTTTTYTITGTDGSGCTSSTTALVNVSISPSTATSQTNISCNGGSNGSATIAVSGGAPGYSYLWNNGQITATLSGLTAGTYTCTVTDANSCSTITAVTLSEPAAIAGIQSPAICVGDNYPVGSSTYTAAGTYTDILTATNGCDSTVTTNLTVNPLPSLAVAATDTNVCVYSSAVSLIAIPTGGTWSGAGIIGSTFSPAIAGAGTTVITYAYSDGNACSNTANIAMLVDLCTGINKFKNNTSFTVYPSPVSDELIIEFQGNKNNTGFEIVNPIGQVIFNGNLLEKTVVQTSNFAPGVYLIKLKNGKSYEFKKIVKE